MFLYLFIFACFATAYQCYFVIVINTVLPRVWFVKFFAISFRNLSFYLWLAPVIESSWLENLFRLPRSPVRFGLSYRVPYFDSLCFRKKWGAFAGLPVPTLYRNFVFVICCHVLGWMAARLVSSTARYHCLAKSSRWRRSISYAA